VTAGAGGGGVVVMLNGVRLDPEAGTLARAGQTLPLRARSFALLCHLARHAGAVLCKSELMDAVWPDVIVSEDSLTQAVRDIRVALGDDAGTVLQTVRGRGYLLVADAAPPATPAGAAAPPRLALVPFEDRTASPDLAPVIDLLCDEIAAGLSRFRSVTVLGRASVEAAQRLHPGDPGAMARALGAAYVVEGVARRDASGFLASLRLTDGETGALVWSESFDCNGDRVLTLRDRVPRRIVGELASSVEAEDAARATRRPTDSLTAFEHFARGVVELKAFRPDAVRAAAASFERAVAADPHFALAHTYLSVAVLQMDDLGFASPEVKARSLELAERGALMAPGDARCQSTLGWMLSILDRYEASERTMRLALRLNPLDSETLVDMAVVALTRGRFEEALEWVERATEVNPLPPPWFETPRYDALHMLGRYAEAAQSLARLPDLNGWRSLRMAAIQLKAGNRDEALRYRARAEALLPPGEDWPRRCVAAWNFERPEHRERLLSDLREVLELDRPQRGRS
jgi:DNA-binding winged helix-turn-helix (wHTH) protein/tetratricopeptide (TPR) repeat protein